MRLISNTCDIASYLVRQEVRDKFESFGRRNSSGAGLHVDPMRYRSSEDVPSSKEVVSDISTAFPMLHNMPILNVRVP